MNNMNKTFKRYLTYIFIALIFSCVMSLFMGCSGKNVGVVDSGVKDIVVEQEKTTSFKTTTYSSPFLEFKYPDDWELYTENYNIPDMDTVVIYKGYINLPHNDNNMVLIMIGRNNNTTIKTSIEARDISLSKLTNLVKAGKAELKGKSILNDNIAIYDAITWDRTPMRVKTYYYINENGRFYAAYIMTYNDNWDKTQTQEIVRVFEESLKFKE